MPTAMTHALVGLGLGKCFTGRRMPLLFWGLAAGLAALPDLDVLAFKLGIPYESPFGHRGFTHSLLFAFLLGVPLAFLTYRRLRAPFLDLAGFFFVVIASHGILDAFTNGGEGIAFFWPLDIARYFFPWRPIQVSDIGMSFFSGGRGGLTLWSEFVWVCVPMALVVATVMGWRTLVAWVAPMSEEIPVEEMP
jgi:inner membrane protein